MTDCHNIQENVKEFIVQGIRLSLPDALLTPVIQKAIESGRYESLEARQLPRFLRDGDRLLEFGGGLGFISALACNTVKLNGCTVVEANPQLIPVIEQTHSLNGVSSTVINGVAVAAGSLLAEQITIDGTLPFYITTNFWGASLFPSKQTVEVLQVPVLQLRDLLERSKPTVIICDIEGGELDLFAQAQLTGVRHAFFEVHKSVIGLRGINDLSKAMEREGLFYDPDFSIGATMMFSRPDA